MSKPGLKVIIFGATGMVGQGVLRETLVSSAVERVLTIGRRPSGHPHAKVTEVVHADLTRLEDLGDQLRGWDACFFCLGRSSAGVREADYVKVTYDLTMTVARTLAELNPGLTFVYVSAAGADPTERSKMMWARVRGRLETDLERIENLPTYVFRPGIIEPQDGIKSSTPAYRRLYKITKPILPLLRRLWPARISSTRIVGRAMIAVAAHGFSKRVLHTPDFLEAARGL